MSITDVRAQPIPSNHASFEAPPGFEEPPGYGVIENHLNAGFGILFRDRKAAEDYLQEPLVTAPLGCVSKQRPDSTWKHRVILDLRMNAVNQAASLPERQVLPTCYQHAADLAQLAREGERTQTAQRTVSTMILDFRDAFMGIPLAQSEWAFNACEVKKPIRRTRPPATTDEAEEGRVIVWTVLGFGGRANPLVFARCAAFACRSAQGLLRPSWGASGCTSAGPTRLQMYVDDPVATTLGTPEETATAIDLIMLWWMLLGIPLALPKGVLSDGEHTWIGALYTLRASPRGWSAVVTVPQKFADELYELLGEFSRGQGHVSKTTVEKVLGKAGRLAYVIPPARAFVGALWGAFGAAREAARQNRREAPPGRFATRRFAKSAAWLRTLLRPETGEELMPLEQIVETCVEPIDPADGMVTFDACPFGGGAVLHRQGAPTEYFVTAWSRQMADEVGENLGDPAGQSTWEYLTLYIALLVWGSRFRHSGLALVGDNTASLSAAVSGKGKRGMNHISAEIAWRKVRFSWRYAVSHLPTEHNSVADHLSRMASPDGPHELPSELATARRVEDLLHASWWKCL